MHKQLALFALLATIAATAVQTEARPESNEKANNFCVGCRSIVSFIARFNSTNNRDEYKNVFKTYCELYYPPGQGPCSFFTESIFYAMELIDPVYSCDRIGACGKVHFGQQKLQSKGSNRVNNILCDTCEQIVTQVQGELEDPAFINLIHQQVTTYCKYLKVIDEEQQCLQMLNNYVDEAIDFVRHLSPLQFCQSVSLCSPTKSQVITNNIVSPSVLARYQGFGLEEKVSIDGRLVEDRSDMFKSESTVTTKTPTCMLCKTVVKETFRFLKNNRTEDTIRNGLDKICGLVYKHNTHNLDQCEEMVKAYTKEMVEIMVDETDPELVCMLLEFCVHQIETPAKHIDVGQFIAMLEPSIEVGSMKNCFECKLFIQYLRDAIDKPDSKEYVKNWLLSNLCDSFDDEKLKKSCTTMIDNYADVFFETLSKELDPKEACVQLHACTNERTKVSERVIDAIEPETVYKELVPLVKKKVNKSSVCDQCIDIVTKIDEYLSTHPIDHDVSTLIDQVCNNIPNQSAKDECIVLIKTFGQDIAQAISTMDNPRQLCSKILLC